MVLSAEEPVGTLTTALAHASRLLQTRPALAEQQADEILKVAPGHLEALALRGAARRMQGDLSGALAVLQPLTARAPHFPDGHFELGLALAQSGQHEDAVSALTRATQFNPKLSAAWRALGDQHTILGDARSADAAYAESIRAAVNDPRLMEAAVALCEGQLAIAERLLKSHLMAAPTDVAAIRMLAEVAARLGRYDDSETLLERCLELAPSFNAARHNYALVLNRQIKAGEALRQIDVLLREEPANPSYRFLKAAVLARVGEYDEAIAIYERLAHEFPSNWRGWMSLGHAYRTAGRQDQSIAAYSKSIELAPNCGEAYWSLANMKTYRFDDSSIACMLAQLDRSEISEEDRFHLHYALGKAFEDAGDYSRSFAHYEEGARRRRAAAPHYDADTNSQQRVAATKLFTTEFFAQRRGFGAEAPDPIFVVGLPRAGSTLIEQVLSSHSAVEGTMELPDLVYIAKTVGDGKIRGGDYPAALADMSPDQLRALGEEYIARTRIQRKTDRPFFIDKMPNNFHHVGLIHLILPNAKIIDARRHPMACGFSAFKQHFARGQNFSYNLSDVGRYYADYVALMQHFDTVLPGRVHRVIYEDMVANPEAEIRRLVAYCGLPFEQSCIDFHSNDRPVRTASSEQVRQPIYSSGVDHWRHYEPWLGPLKDALGPVLDAYPSPPPHHTQTNEPLQGEAP